MGNFCKVGGWLVVDDSEVLDPWGAHTCPANGQGLVGSQVRVAEFGCCNSMCRYKNVGKLANARLRRG